MENESTYDAALEQFTTETPDVPADPTPGTVPADALPTPASTDSKPTDAVPTPTDAAAKPADAAPAPTDAPPVDPLEALKDNPRVQELQQAETFLLDSVKMASGYGIEVKSAEQLKNVIDDGAAINGWLAGKVPTDTILGNLVKFWPKEQADKVLGEVEQFIAKYRGAPPPAAAAAGQPNALEKEVASIKETLASQKQAEERAAVEQVRQKAVQTLTSKVSELVKDPKHGLPSGDGEVQQWVNDVAAAIGRDPAAIKRIEEGKGALDIEKAFTEINNRRLAYLKKYMDGAAAKKENRNNELPKVPAGGAPPAPGTKKINYANYDERIAAATEQFKQ